MTLEESSISGYKGKILLFIGGFLFLLGIFLLSPGLAESIGSATCFAFSGVFLAAGLAVHFEWFTYASRREKIGAFLVCLSITTLGVGIALYLVGVEEVRMRIAVGYDPRTGQPVYTEVSRYIRHYASLANVVFGVTVLSGAVGLFLKLKKEL